MSSPHPPNVAAALQARIDSLFARLNYERESAESPNEFKLEGMRNFLKELGDPHLNYPVIHVTGTKGKGSVSAFIGTILQEAGFQVGVYSSPHLDRIHQRFCINGVPITDQDLIDVIDQIQPAVERMDDQLSRRGERGLTFFEVSTGIMFQHFANEHVDVAVVEVGLGGRLDSTNVCHPATCVITNVSLDHMAQLGNTVEKIAWEKAGIIKSGVPVVTGVRQPGPLEVVRRKAESMAAPLVVLDDDLEVSENPGGSGPVNGDPQVGGGGTFCVQLDWKGESLKWNDLQVQLLGKHQRANAGLAVAAVSLFAHENPLFVHVDVEKAIRRGISKTFLPGRIERKRILFEGQEHDVILDIAHNPNSMNALLETLDSLSLTPSTCVFACSGDKDAKAMLDAISKSGITHLILTRFLENPRAVHPNILEEMLMSESSECQVVVEPDPIAATQMALRSTSDRAGLVLFAGSVFLIAEVRRWLVGLSED